MSLEDKMRVENEINLALRRLGLTGWSVVWSPDKTQKNDGQVLSDRKTILIFSENPDEAMETLVHEAIEIMMMPTFFHYRTFINYLIEVIEKLTYAEKERSIKRLTPFLLEKIKREIGGEEA